MTYQIQVSAVESGEKLAQAYGDIETMAYHARKLVLEDEKQYSVSVTEHKAIGDTDGQRTLVGLTSNGRVIGMVVKGELRAERKRLNIPDTSATDGETANVPKQSAESVVDKPATRTRAAAK